MSDVLVSSIVDAHLHLWDREALTYGWLDGLGIDGPYGPDGVPVDGAPVPIEGFVFVQAECDPGQSVNEVNWVNQVSSGARLKLEGIVARVDLTTSHVDADLAAIAALDNVVGIRHNIQGEDEGFARSLVEGVNHLSALGLSFDLCCRADELDQVIELVDRCDSSARFVLDHLGKPAVGDPDRFEMWSDRISELAKAPNVFCKLSGLQTEIAIGAEERPDLFAPYLDHAMEAFTIDRVMYGSDWPVCTLNGSMGEWVATVATALGGDADAHRKVFRDNARSFYQTANATQELP